MERMQDCQKPWRLQFTKLTRSSLDHNTGQVLSSSKSSNLQHQPTLTRITITHFTSNMPRYHNLDPVALRKGSLQAATLTHGPRSACAHSPSNTTLPAFFITPPRPNPFHLIFSNFCFQVRLTQPSFDTFPRGLTFQGLQAFLKKVTNT
jgi:hypothetical protein